MKNRPRADLSKESEAYSLRLTDPLPHHLWPELFFGIVAPIGTPREGLKRDLTRFLTQIGYTTFEVKISSLLSVSQGWAPQSKRMEDLWKLSPQAQPFYEARTAGLMDLGNEIRKMTASQSVMAEIAAYAIHAFRRSELGTAESGQASESKIAFFLDQLKRPEEVYALQDIYGPRFHLVGCSSPESERIKYLSEKIAKSHNSSRGDLKRAEAYKLATRDFFEEEDSFGQNVRSTYALADVFVSIEPNRERDMAWQSERYVQLVFGNYRWTPVQDEHGIQMAHAAALNSADLARQVGAAICTPEGSCISVGWNEVPRAGGGVYWASVLDREPDARDIRQNKDPTNESRIRVLTQIIERLQNNGWLSDDVVARGSEEEIVADLVRSNPRAQAKISQLIQRYFDESATSEDRKHIHDEFNQLWEPAAATRRGEAARREFLEYLTKAAEAGKGSGYLEYLITTFLAPILQDSEVMSINEFGRTVHAELTAITDAARRGVSLQGSTLFSTTFPCHECARHILAAGISRVVYLQPYPKSYAKESHGDSIQIDDLTTYTFQRKVRFEPFVGVGPRRYSELFQYSRAVFNRKTPDGGVASWQARKPRYTEPSIVYEWREEKYGKSLMKNSGFDLPYDDCISAIQKIST